MNTVEKSGKLGKQRSNHTQTTFFIQIRNMDALRQWNGSLLQIQIKCRGQLNTEERHCFLIKLQSLLPLEPEVIIARDKI